MDWRGNRGGNVSPDDIQASEKHQRLFVSQSFRDECDNLGITGVEWLRRELCRECRATPEYPWLSIRHAPLSTEVVPQTAWRGLQILVAYYELRDCDADMDSDLPVIGHWGYWHIKDLAEERFKNRRRTKR